MGKGQFIISNKKTIEASSHVFYLKNPTGYKIERYNITTLSRIANGEMVGDLVARKKKFYFTYDAINAIEMNNILDAVYYMPQIFFWLHEPQPDGTYQSFRVYVGSIPQTLHRAGPNLANWIWKDVSFNLIEK